MGRWSTPEFLIPRLSSSNRFSIAESGDALSILCDEARVALRKEDGRLNAAWFGSLAFPIEDAIGGQRHKLMMRGFAHKPESARGAVILDIAGGLVTREFPYGQSFEESFEIETMFVINKWMNRRITVSFALLLERQSDDDEAALEIDTSDAAVIQLIRSN